MTATNYLEQKLLEHAFRATDFVEPATVYCALFTAAPGEAGGGTEVTGGSYARQAITFGAYSGGAVSNSALVDFGASTADWGTVTHFAIFDALTVGNMLAFGTLGDSKVITNGDSAEFPIGTLIVTMD